MFERAEDVLSGWISKVNTGDWEGVISLYGQNADLMPTFSSEIRKDPEGIRSYFERISSNNQVSVELDSDSLIVQNLSGTLYSLAGIYSWILVDGCNKQSLLARFTFTIDIQSDNPILHHHSSLVPEE